jgi:uncharacterized protein (DUF58 family)
MNAFMAWLRPALAGLTTRGRSLLAAGLAAAACAVVLGQRDLLRVAILLIALPLGCALSLARTRYRLALTRTVAPPRVVAGGTARVRLELDNLTRLGTQVLLAEERVPYALGAPPRFVLNRLPGGRRAAVTYSLRSEIRGRYPVGPLRLRLTDAFGMCEMTRSFTSVDALVVVPRTWPLTTAGAGGRWSASGESQSRHGDDLRRVHWRSTAHRGELMVRTDEQPRQMRATVLLDTREAGHRGDGPASSFEWAVSTAASAAVHLIKQRYGVRLQVDGRARSWVPPSGDGAGTLLDDLAVVGTGLPDELAAAIGSVARAGGDGLIVAVLGEVPEAEAKALARMGRNGARGVAIMLRTTAWTTVSAREAQRADSQRAAAIRLLREAGWSVAEAGPEETATQVWARLGSLDRPVAPPVDTTAATPFAAREVAS